LCNKVELTYIGLFDQSEISGLGHSPSLVPLATVVWRFSAGHRRMALLRRGQVAAIVYK
jgi:hypothetical protein